MIIKRSKTSGSKRRAVCSCRRSSWGSKRSLRMIGRRKSYGGSWGSLPEKSNTLTKCSFPKRINGCSWKGKRPSANLLDSTTRSLRSCSKAWSLRRKKKFKGMPWNDRSSVNLRKGTVAFHDRVCHDRADGTRYSTSRDSEGMRWRASTCR